MSPIPLKGTVRISGADGFSQAQNPINCQVCLKHTGASILLESRIAMIRGKAGNQWCGAHIKKRCTHIVDTPGVQYCVKIRKRLAESAPYSFHAGNVFALTF